MTELATHVLIELWGVDHQLLDDPKALEVGLIEAAKAARCEVLGALSHKFEPQGASVVVLVAESHLSVHTWPEHGYAAVDILTCGKTLPEAGVESIVRTFKPSSHSVERVARGARERVPSTR